jgi:hypothetical protein
MRKWLQSSKLLDCISTKTFLYVGKFLLYIFVYCLLHRLLRLILQKGCCIMYYYMFHIMKYFLCCICVIFAQTTSLTLCMPRSAFETSVPTASHARVVRPWAAWPKSTEPGMIWDKPEYPDGLSTHATRIDQDLWMSGLASLGSMPHGHDTKNWSRLGKILSSTNGARFRSETTKASNAIWTRHMMPTVWSTRLGATWWKIYTAWVGW